MPTTSNFGWTTPADTDLVKDGALAIRTLGNGIDTSFLDLKGGTTDQVLAKNSNTDLDFKWVAQDDSNAIQNAIVDAKGDLISATAADTPARLAVGTNGQVLTADSTTATGLKWAAPAGGGKVLQVVQATSTTSTTVATSTTYTDTTLSASITPSATNSKILVMVNQGMKLSGASESNGGGAIRILRDATAIFTPTAGKYEHFFYTIGAAQSLEVWGTFNYCYLDSPSTTSSTTYKTQGIAYIVTNSRSVTFQDNSSTSTITLMEIGA